VPRERYDSDIRAKIGTYLASIFVGRVSAYYPFFPEGPLVRVHFIIGRIDPNTPEADRAALESAVAGIVRSWTDGLMDALSVAHGPDRGQALLERYGDAFSQGYQEAYPPTEAVSDIRVIEGLSADKPLAAVF
jgi:glutamate dehydrogenase